MSDDKNDSRIDQLLSEQRDPTELLLWLSLWDKGEKDIEDLSVDELTNYLLASVSENLRLMGRVTKLVTLVDGMMQVLTLFQAKVDDGSLKVNPGFATQLEKLVEGVERKLHLDESVVSR